MDTVVEGMVRHHRAGSAQFGFWLNASGRNVETIAARLIAANVPFARSTPGPLNQLASILATADVHLITLRSSFSGIVLPSKVYACIASRRPILFVGPASSDIHLLCTQTDKLAMRVLNRVMLLDLLKHSNVSLPLARRKFARAGQSLRSERRGYRTKL